MPPRYLVEGNSAVTANVLGSIADKQRQYSEPIIKNHTAVENLAQTLQRLRNELIDLLDTSTDAEKAEIQTFLDEQTKAVHELAQQNVQRQRRVRDFIAGVKIVQKDTHDGKNNGADTNYKEAIAAAVTTAQQQAQETEVEVHQDKLYLAVMEALGETPAGGDDEIAFVVGNGSSTQNSNLKCPITGVLMEDPVKNSICGHSYSRAGIRSHMQAKQHRAKCPVAGCYNTQVVTERVLADDYGVQQAVRKEKRRQEQEQQRIASQANDLMDSDDEE